LDLPATKLAAPAFERLARFVQTYAVVKRTSRSKTETKTRETIRKVRGFPLPPLVRLTSVESKASGSVPVTQRKSFQFQKRPDESQAED